MQSMLNLKNQPSLKDIQVYVEDLERERGFSDETVIQSCLLLGEEVGELFKAVRKSEKMKIDQMSNFSSIEDELADIIIYLAAIANRYHIDLETALRNKEEINKQRAWK